MKRTLGLLLVLSVVACSGQQDTQPARYDAARWDQAAWQ
jgi:hypothetical protein